MSSNPAFSAPSTAVLTRNQKRFIYRLLTRHGCLPVFAGSSLIFQWKWTRFDLKLAVRMREF
jgi:hypothetical protein